MGGEARQKNSRDQDHGRDARVSCRKIDWNEGQSNRAYRGEIHERSNKGNNVKTWGNGETILGTWKEKKREDFHQETKSSTKSVGNRGDYIFKIDLLNLRKKGEKNGYGVPGVRNNPRKGD